MALAEHHDHAMEYILMAISVAIGVTGWWFGRSVFLKDPQADTRIAAKTGFLYRLAPRRVLFHPIRKRHHCAAPIGFDIAAKGGHLVAKAIRDDRDRPVIDPRGHGLQAGGSGQIRRPPPGLVAEAEAEAVGAVELVIADPGLFRGSGPKSRGDRSRIGLASLDVAPHLPHRINQAGGNRVITGRRS